VSSASGEPIAPLVGKGASPPLGEEMATLRREKSWPRYLLATTLVPLPLIFVTYGVKRWPPRPFCHPTGI